jgi:glycerate 2-kinase
VRVVVAPDKFRGTATASEVCAAVDRAVRSLGGTCESVPMADGGEGFLDVLGGPNRTTTVMGPLGDAVQAGWRLVRRTAVIEMARASGLALVGGAEGNDPIAASSHGTGELVSAALEQGANRILLGVGGSATTDGGLGAQRAIYPLSRLKGVHLVVACDVRTRFIDAARVFGPQKGATPAQVQLLERRLERLAQVYREEHGVDVRELESSGAAGGLAGGLACVGAQLVPGFEVVADEVGLAEQIEDADLVITGEGFCDEQSFEGKVVGGVVELARAVGVPVLVVAGEVFDGVEHRVPSISLVQRFGEERSMADAVGCIEQAVREHLSAG